MSENPQNQPISVPSYYGGDRAQEYSRLRSLVFWFAAASALSNAVQGASRLHLGWQLRHAGGRSSLEVAAVAIVSALLASQIGAMVSCVCVARGNSRASIWALATEGVNVVGSLAGWCLSLWSLFRGGPMQFAVVNIYVGLNSALSVIDLAASLPALIVVLLVWSHREWRSGGMMTPPTKGSTPYGVA